MDASVRLSPFVNAESFESNGNGVHLDEAPTVNSPFIHAERVTPDEGSPCAAVHQYHERRSARTYLSDGGKGAVHRSGLRAHRAHGGWCDQPSELQASGDREEGEL